MNWLKGPTSKKYRNNLFKILLISILVVAILQLIYITGGTKMVFVQLLYIPIILSSLFWGTYSGLIAGVVCGILVGPFIPLDVPNGIMQDPINWISRLLIFSLIGFLTGYMFERINRLNLKSPFYNLPNVQKLLRDIEERSKSKEKFKLFSIKLTNLNDIEKYVDNKLVFAIVDNLAKKLSHCCGRNAIYSYEKDELIILACKSCNYDYEEKIKEILEDYFDFPVSMGGYKIRVSLKVGIYEYKGEEITPIEIYNKARIAYEQGEEKETGLYYYNVDLESRRREVQNITGSLLESIDRNELYVMYQPKIDIINNRISGVEALVRWKRNGNEHIGPNIFIPIAEEIGFINRIAKYVFDSATTQINNWKSKGIDLKCSINTSVNELIDDNFTAWAKDIITSKNLERLDFEIEITERAIAYDDKKLIEKMYFLKELGYKISIDDFGTGYNSLMSINEIPFDKLKIDKYFIDRIHKIEIEELVKHFIEYAHTFDKIVIAEGVETEEQLNILKRLNCDEVQGYYYSKPLLPEELVEFYINFNKGNLKEK
ncbi:EAL domain-containing protein [Herbinix luporum]|uniref:EAL domain-containing protein n=1 Tax=Herbinix luporum TaxID=1679721 RepID=UPI0023F4A4D0|nr:EAL domain-containing protein [Herbinix luporum]